MLDRFVHLSGGAQSIRESIQPAKQVSLHLGLVHRFHDHHLTVRHPKGFPYHCLRVNSMVKDEIQDADIKPPATER